MILGSTANGKQMSELSMLTIIIQAAAAVKNKDGDTSMHGYMDNPSQCRATCEDTPNLAVLDSIGDTLLQCHQVLAISSDLRSREQCEITTPISDTDTNVDSPAEPPISGVSTVMSIIASVVPNPNDRKRDNSECEGPLGNIRQVTKGKSMWAHVKVDPLYCADK